MADESVPTSSTPMPGFGIERWVYWLLRLSRGRRRWRRCLQLWSSLRVRLPAALDRRGEMTTPVRRWWCCRARGGTTVGVRPMKTLFTHPRRFSWLTILFLSSLSFVIRCIVTPTDPEDKIVPELSFQTSIVGAKITEEQLSAQDPSNTPEDWKTPGKYNPVCVAIWTAWLNFVQVFRNKQTNNGSVLYFSSQSSLKKPASEQEPWLIYASICFLSQSSLTKPVNEQEHWLIKVSIISAARVQG